MKFISLGRGRRNGGMVMLATVFLLLVLLPITLVFVRWVSVHRKGTTRARIHIKEYYDAISSANIIRYRIQNSVPAAYRWAPTATRSDTVIVGDGTTTSSITTSITTD